MQNEHTNMNTECGLVNTVLCLKRANDLQVQRTYLDLDTLYSSSGNVPVV